MRALLPKSRFASLVLFVLCASSAQAAIIFNAPTASTTGNLEITNDISFTVTTAGSMRAIALKGWVTSSDGHQNYATNFTPSGLAYSLNNAAPTTTNTFYLADNYNETLQEVVPNDGFFLWNTPLTLAVNDVFTLKAGTYTLPVGVIPNFNSQAPQTFTGNAFLMNAESFNRLSAVTSVGAVPEPSRALFLLGGLISLLFRRRRM